MKKKIYEAPRTVLYSVEVEGSFATSIVKPDKNEVTSTGQELNIHNGFEGNEAVDWNDAKWE